MVDLSDSRNVSKTLAAFGLIFAPVLMALATVMSPPFSEDDQIYFNEVASSPVMHQLTALLFVVAALLLVPGLLGVVRLLRGRRGAVGQVGASLLLAGAIVLSGFFGITIIEATATQPQFDRNQAIALLSSAENSGFVFVYFPVAVLGGLVLGSLLLALGLFLRRAVPVWVPALLVLQTVVSFLANDTLLSTISFVLLAVVLGALAWKIMSVSDEEWGRWQPLPDRPRRAESEAAQPVEARGSAMA